MNRRSFNTTLVEAVASCVLVLVLLTGVSERASAQAGVGEAPRDSMATVELPAELNRVLRDYERGWRARDADSLAALFTPDGFILRPGHPPVRGRAAIREAYRGSGGPLHLRAQAFAREETIAYIIGGYRGRPVGPDSGKFILTLRRLDDGRWYITADMDNGNR